MMVKASVVPVPIVANEVPPWKTVNPASAVVPRLSVRD